MDEITSTADTAVVKIPALPSVTWVVTALCSTGELYTWTHEGPMAVIERVADGALELIPVGGARWGLQVERKGDGEGG